MLNADACLAEWWSLGFRQHTCTSDQDTSSVSEGAVSNKVKARRLDWLLYALQFKVLPHYQGLLEAQALGASSNALHTCTMDTWPLIAAEFL